MLSFKDAKKTINNYFAKKLPLFSLEGKGLIFDLTCEVSNALLGHSPLVAAHVKKSAG